jgi:hypothetical protein
MSKPGMKWTEEGTQRPLIVKVIIEEGICAECQKVLARLGHSSSQLLQDLTFFPLQPPQML